MHFASEDLTSIRTSCGRVRRQGRPTGQIASFETNPRVPNAKDVSRSQVVFVDPLAINERAAGTAAIRERGLLADQYHLAVQHGNVRVFQSGRSTHVAADEEQLLFLERENTAAVPTGDYSKLVAHRSVLPSAVA